MNEKLVKIKEELEQVKAETVKEIEIADENIKLNTEKIEKAIESTKDTEDRELYLESRKEIQNAEIMKDFYINKKEKLNTVHLINEDEFNSKVKEIKDILIKENKELFEEINKYLNKIESKIEVATENINYGNEIIEDMTQNIYRHPEIKARPEWEFNIVSRQKFKGYQLSHLLKMFKDDYSGLYHSFNKSIENK